MHLFIYLFIYLIFNYLFIIYSYDYGSEESHKKDLELKHYYYVLNLRNNFMKYQSVTEDIHQQGEQNN
jgi:hypothetical protein